MCSPLCEIDLPDGHCQQRRIAAITCLVTPDSSNYVMYNYKTVHFLEFLWTLEMVSQGQVGLDHCRACWIREQVSNEVHPQSIWRNCKHVERKEHEIH